MKKAITTILSILLLISCLTVNVFANETDTDTPTEEPIVDTTDKLSGQQEDEDEGSKDESEPGHNIEIDQNGYDNQNIPSDDELVVSNNIIYSINKAQDDSQSDGDDSDPTSTNEMSTFANQQVNSIVTSARIVAGVYSFELSKFYREGNNFGWHLDTNNLSQSEKEGYFTYINSDNVVIKFEYYISGDANKHETSIVTRNSVNSDLGLFGNYSTYATETQRNYFFFGDYYKVIDMSEVSSVVFTIKTEDNRSEQYAVNIGNPVQFRGQKYYSITSDYTFEHYFKYDLKIIDNNNKTLEEITNCSGEMEEGNNLYNVKIRGEKYYDTSSNCIVNFCTNYLIEDYLNEAFVVPVEGYSNVNANINRERKEYEWNVIVSVSDFYAGNTSFRLRNNTGSDITLSQTEQSQEHAGPITFNNTNGIIEFIISKKGDVVFDITSNNETQRHTVRMMCNDNQYYPLTAIESLTNCDNVWFNLYDSKYDSINNYFSEVNLFIDIPELGFNDLISKINNPDTLDLNNYYSMSIREDYNQKGNVTFDVVDNANMIIVNYIFDFGSLKQKIFLHIQKSNNNNNNNPQERPDLIVDNTPFRLEEHNGVKLYFEDNNQGVRLNRDEIIAAVGNVNYEALVIYNRVDGFDFKDPRSEHIIDDGHEMASNQQVFIKIYYIDDNTKLNTGVLTKDDLKLIDNYNEHPINAEISFGEFDDAEDVEQHLMVMNRKLPYRCNNGGLYYPFEEPDDLDDVETGIGVAIKFVKNNNKIYIHRQLKLYSPAEITFFNIVDESNDNYNPDNVIYLSGENATAKGLEDAVNSLRHSAHSAVVLESNITLNRDVYLKHGTIDNSYNIDDPKFDLEINLNGKTIDTNGFKIVNLRNSSIHFTNNVKDGSSGYITNSKLYINPETKESIKTNHAIVENYGSLFVMDGIAITNVDGVGIRTYNSGELNLYRETEVRADVCVDIVENEIYADGRNNANFSLLGDLWAGNVAVRNKTINSEIINNINISPAWEAISQKYCNIVSDNIGIETIGNAKVELSGCNLNAKNPIKISGGTLEIRYSNINGTSTQTSEPAIFVASNENNATSTSILIDTDSSVNISCHGPLISENTVDDSKIKSIYFYSIQNEDTSYFDYGSLFSFVSGKAPASGSINITGGHFKDDTCSNYLIGATLSTNTVNSYYYLIKNATTEVSDYTTLANALSNPNILSVRVTRNIEGPKNNDNSENIIRFDVNNSKVLFLNGNIIKNVKFVPETTIQDAPIARFVIDSQDGNLGYLENDGTVIENFANQLYIYNVNIKSNSSTAISMHAGEMYLHGTYDSVNNVYLTNIHGAKGIEVSYNDNYSTNGIQYKNIGDININDYNIISNKGPAIDVICTGVFSYLNLKDCVVQTNFTGTNSDSSAIRINDRTRMSGNNVDIEGKMYGVFFEDNLSGKGFVNNYAGLQLYSGSIISGKIAFRMGDKTVAYFDEIKVVAETKIMDILGFTQYNITRGLYKVTNKDGVILDFNGKKQDPTDGWHNITGGYYSHYVENDYIFNMPESEYTYKCMPVDPAKNPEKWVVARNKNGENNYQYIEVPPGRDIEIDGGKLDNAYDKEETTGYDSFDVVLTVKYKNDPSTKDKFDGHGNGFKEYYDIHVDKIIENEAIENIDSTKNYQLVTIPLNNLKLDGENIIYAKIDNVMVYHKHGNSDPVTLKKINKNNAANAKEECYYLEEINGTWYLNIITRQFSDFAIAEDTKEVSIQNLKSDYSLKLQYEDIYSLNNFTTPKFAIYGNNQSIGVDDVEVVYYNAEGTDYFYGTKLPDKAGNYIAEWTVKEGKDITGSGSKQFALIEGDLSLINIKKGLVYTGSPIQIIDNIDNIDAYGFAIVDSNNNLTTFDGQIPTVVNAGTYKLSYSKNGTTKFIGYVNVNKAEIDKDKVIVPAFTNVTKGTLLSELKFTESGWNWVNPKDTVSDSNYAVYNPNKNNFADLLVTVPVYVKETVAGKDVSISNTVKADEKLDDIKVENNNITQSVLDIIKNVKSDTVVTGDAKEFISSSDNESLTISTELVKNEVTESAKNEALEKAEVKAENVAMVLDFKINIKVTKGSETKTGTITELAEPVKLTVKLPKGSKTTAAEGKELKYYVLVIHGDDVLKIPATLNAADGTVTFSADKFSTYILVSEEVTKTVVENSTPSYVPSGNKKPVVNTAAK